MTPPLKLGASPTMHLMMSVHRSAFWGNPNKLGFILIITQEVHPPHPSFLSAGALQTAWDVEIILGRLISQAGILRTAQRLCIQSWKVYQESASGPQLLHQGAEHQSQVQAVRQSVFALCKTPPLYQVGSTPRHKDGGRCVCLGTNQPCQQAAATWEKNTQHEVRPYSQNTGFNIIWAFSWLTDCFVANS